MSWDTKPFIPDGHETRPYAYSRTCPHCVGAGFYVADGEYPICPGCVQRGDTVHLVWRETEFDPHLFGYYYCGMHGCDHRVEVTRSAQRAWKLEQEKSEEDDG